MPQMEKDGGMIEQNGDEEIIKELCVCNGVSYEKVSQDGSRIDVLEMFFSGFPRMVGLTLFPKLSTLTLVGQGIRHVQGLEHCRVLKELWVAECQLNEISGLQNCTRLHKLYLYDNKISEISGLDHLTNLHVLWLNKNRLSEIKGLGTLENLKELNLADNFIRTIGNSLDQNKNLQILNLSGNKISSFKELTRLARLSGLRELELKDPLCHPTPVCRLCNYATHVLYHMPSLQRLDSYDISSKSIKEAAESTVMKKIMYYSMRARSVQRQWEASRARLLQHRAKLMKLPEERIRTLSYTLKNLELELAEVQEVRRKSTRPLEESRNQGDPPPNCSDPGHEQKVQHKLDSVRERIKIWEQHLEQVEGTFQRDISLASDRKELSIHFLVMELETVGNIRFEEGNTSHVWFNSCYDLLVSRFCVWDYKPYNITGIKINRIMRIHNRALRLQFEDKLLELLDRDESPLFSQNYKHWMEYLFYVPDPERSTENDETLHILEHGFRSADSYKALGRERAVPLTNSVSASEWLRMRHAQTQTAKPSGRATDPLPFRHGQLIVSKVFLGPSVPAKDDVPVDPDFYPKVHSVYQKARTRQLTTTQEKSCREALFSPEQQASDCSQTLFYVFDHELVLPEYLIDFEYITQDMDQPSCLCTPRSAAVPVAPASRGSDMALWVHEQAHDEMVLGLEPVLAPRPKLLTLDEPSILTAARANVLSQITVLNLHGNSLNKLKAISRLTALRHLTISCNELTHLDDISHLPSLETVDASFNRVVTLAGVCSLGRLSQLDLRWNQLSRAKEDAAVLRKHTPCLLHLDTRHNPWARHDSVRMVLLGQLKTLTHLDGVLITEAESAAASQMIRTSKINLTCLLAHSCTAAERPRCLSLLTAAQLLTYLNPSPWTHAADLELGWTAKITALNMDGQHLSRIANLDKLVNLRWASFNDNDLTRIEGLEHCPLLEELSLDDNNISSLDGVTKMQYLVRLSINRNQLQSLDGSVLDFLPNLHFLSAESNCISSLDGVQRSRSLFELYAGNNDISSSRDIYHLKALSSLIILDLLGNPLVRKLENYRAYVIFHLPSLKALDCLAVEDSESESAKDLFAGRLTPDVVAENLGHSNFKDIVDLELMACSIRMVDLTPADMFGNLRSVNLEHNSLTSFSGLVYLPSVKVLCLNYNQIESILPRQKAQAHLSNRQLLYQKVHSSGYGQQNHIKNSREGASGHSLEPLMASLEVLHLGHNNISNLGELQLSRLINLKALFLQGNEISHVEGLEGLRHLRQLVLDQNRIKTLSEGSLCHQASLLELHLAENRLRDLSYLEPLCQLRRLFLDMNKLQDISELDKLEALSSLTELSVVGNPMARRSLHRPVVVLRLPRLQVLDGIMITLEERTRALMYAEEQYPSPPVVGADLTLPGLVPLCRAPPGRGTGLSSGLQHLLGNEITTTSYLEEPHYSSKYKKRAGGTQSRSAQSDGGYRHRGASSLPITGHRVYTNTDPDTRYTHTQARHHRTKTQQPQSQHIFHNTPNEHM